MIDLTKIKKDIGGTSDDARFAAWMELYQSDEESTQREIEKIFRTTDPLIKILFARFLAHIEEERAILYLTKLLIDENPIVVDNAIAAFLKSKFSKKNTHLIPVLSSPCVRAKVFALNQLAASQVIQAIDPILNLIPKADHELLVEILGALRFFSDRNVAPTIYPYLEHASEDIRFRAVMILGTLYQLGCKEFHHKLILKLSDGSEIVRHGVVWSLSHIKRKGHLKHFLTLSLHDPSPLVRQECLSACLTYPSFKVMRHIISVLTHEKDRVVTLKGESVLLSMPKKVLVKSLKRLLKSRDAAIRHRTMHLYAEHQEGSDEYLSYLKRQFESAGNPKEKIPIIESLGLLENKKAITFLEKHIFANPLLTYTGLMAIAKLWEKSQDFPIIKYLTHPQISDLFKQIPLKHLLKLNVPKFCTPELVTILIKLLDSKNLNVRYLSAQALVQMKEERILVPFFNTIINETDHTARNLLKENIIEFFHRNPLLFVKLFQEYKEQSEAITLLFSLFKESKLSKDNILLLTKTLIEPPLNMLDQVYHTLLIETLFHYLTDKTISLENLITMGVSEELTALLFERLYQQKYRGNPHLKLKLPIPQLLLLIKNEGLDQRKSLVELMGKSDSNQTIPHLIDFLTDNSLASLHPSAAASLKQLIEVSYD